MTYRITATPKPPESHWEDMRGADEHLEHVIEDMAAILRVYHGEDTAADFDRLGISYAESGPEVDPTELALELVNGFCLEAQLYRNYEGTLGRVVFLLGFGGPNIWLDVLYQSEVSEVRLDRYWSGHDRAETTDSRACTIVGDFIQAFWGES